MVGDLANVIDWAPDLVRKHNQDFTEWRRESEEVYDFCSGEHWPEADKTAMASLRKPTLVFNFFGKFINAIVGVQVKNRSFLQYSSVGAEDQPLAWIFDQTARATMDDWFEGELSDAFRDLLCCGYGWNFLSMEFEDGLPRAVLERVDPFAMAWDIAATRRNLVDKRWLSHTKRYSEDDMVALVGRKMTDKCIASDSSYEKDVLTPEANSSLPFQISHFQWRRLEKGVFYRLRDLETGSVHVLPPKAYEAQRALIDASGRFAVEEDETRGYKHYQAKFCGRTLLEEPSELPHGFSYHCMTGFRGRYGRYFSPMKAGMDPQRYSNKFISTMIYDYMTAAKGLFLEEGAVNDIDAFHRDYASADRVKVLADGAISQNKIKMMDGVPINPAINYMIDFAVRAISLTLGINAEILGMTGTEQSNMLERTRQDASLTGFQELFSCERMHRKAMGRVLLGFMSEYYPDETFLRVCGPAIQPFLKPLRDFDVTRADIEIDEEPRTVSRREEVMRTMMEIAHQLGNSLPPQFVQVLLSYTSLPKDALDKIVAGFQPPPDPKAQLEMQQMQADIKKTLAEAQKAIADAQAKMQPMESGMQGEALKLEGQKMKMIGERQSAMDKAALSRQTHEQDMAELFARMQADRHKSALDMAAFAEKAKMSKETKPNDA